MFRTTHPKIYMNHDLVRSINASFTDHPKYQQIHESGCRVMDDDQWTVYKKMLARIAKERKTTKTVTQTRKVRDRRDVDYEPIDWNGKKIMKICDSSYFMEIFKNVPGDSVYSNHVIKCLRGEIDRFDGFFWIPI